MDYATPLKGILSAASSALIAEGRETGRVELTPGILPAWDDCCAGQLYLRVVEVYPTMGANNSAPFPQIDAQQRGVNLLCAIHGLAVHIGLGVIRCAATLSSTGKPPSDAKVTVDGVNMLLDMDTLLNVLVCTSQDIQGIQRLKIDKWLPQGVDGGCHGGEWSAYLLMNPCLCQESES